MAEISPNSEWVRMMDHLIDYNKAHGGAEPVTLYVSHEHEIRLTWADNGWMPEDQRRINQSGVRAVFERHLKPFGIPVKWDSHSTFCR